MTKDHFTSTPDGADGAERSRALATGDYLEPERPDPSELGDLETPRQRMARQAAAARQAAEPCPECRDVGSHKMDCSRGQSRRTS